jgi:hypothetical protein
MFKIILIVAIILALSGCTYKETSITVYSHGRVSVHAVTKGSDAEDALNGNSPTLALP